MRQLAALRRSFGTTAARQRRSLIRALAKQLSDARASASTIRHAHDELLYICAYPDSREVLAGATAGLRVLSARVRTAVNSRHDPDRALLTNSGIAGSYISVPFSPDLLRWLADRFPAAVRIAWTDGSAGVNLDTILSMICAGPETDGQLSERIDTQTWVDRARGRKRRGSPSDIGWLVSQLNRLHCPGAVLDLMWDMVDVPIAWRLAGRTGSRTWTRFPPRPMYHQKRELQRDVDLHKLFSTPLPAPAKLTRTKAEELVSVARETLAARCRETDPVTYANPREVTLFRLEHGVDVALFGMLPERRLPVESYFGFVAARNRVPIAYGGGWMWFHRCEIGVNLFPEFRGGESSVIFGQILRVYRAYYRVRQFLVDPFQFGAGNSVAIRSGAYWFYHRLGFRSVDERLRDVASQEASRIARDRQYRTPARVLRRLAGAKIYLDIGGTRGRPRDAAAEPASDRYQPVAPDLARVGWAVTDWVAAQFHGDRDRAERQAVRQAERWLCGSAPRGQEGHAHEWFCRLAPLVAMCPEVRRWSATQRRGLFALLRAKGGPQERRYVLRSQAHAEWRRAIEEINARALEPEAAGS